MTKTTVNQNEIDKFSNIADSWWDENGKFKPLHKFNPARISYIKEKIQGNLKELKILDIGCGGGLLCEPLARIGAKVTGIDMAQKSINIAKEHAKKSQLDVNYQVIDVEEMAKKKEKFDVVLAMEIIEHVDNVDNFIKAISDCVKKDGLIFIATINRTPKSYLKAIIGAEYILRWLDIGTHSWKKFLKPSEINDLANQNNLQLINLDGFEYSIIKDQWKSSKNLDVNYVMVFKKK